MQSTVKSAQRVVDIIELAVLHPDGLMPVDISRNLGIPLSSLSYLLALLVEREFLTKQGRAYIPGPSLHRLGGHRQDRNLAVEVRALVRALRLATGETASFFVRRDWKLVAIETETSEHNLRYSIAAGSAVPLHCVGAGKAILARLDDAELSRFFAEEERVSHTGSTMVDERQLREELKQIRATGIARTHGEYTAGITGFGIAVVVDGEILGAFGVAVPETRMSSELDVRICSALRDAAVGLAARLGNG